LLTHYVRGVNNWAAGLRARASVMLRACCQKISQDRSDGALPMSVITAGFSTVSFFSSPFCGSLKRFGSHPD